MDDTPRDRARPKSDLAAALRAARAEDAVHVEAMQDLRGIALARLGVLRDSLAPILAQLPDDADFFDVGIMPGETPRLFIDMIAFVEMARDRRHYRLLQDRRHGRMLLAEAETLDDAVDAVTAYIARRLVERERTRASELNTEPGVVIATRPGPRAATPARPAPAQPPRLATRLWHGLAQAFWFVVEVLGLFALLGLLAFAVRWFCQAKGIWPAV